MSYGHPNSPRMWTDPICKEATKTRKKTAGQGLEHRPCSCLGLGWAARSRAGLVLWSADGPPRGGRAALS